MLQCLQVYAEAKGFKTCKVHLSGHRDQGSKSRTARGWTLPVGASRTYCVAVWLCVLFKNKISTCPVVILHPSTKFLLLLPIAALVLHWAQYTVQRHRVRGNESLKVKLVKEKTLRKKTHRAYADKKRPLEEIIILSHVYVYITINLGRFNLSQYKNSMPRKKLWQFTTFIVISSSMPIVTLHIHRQLACLLIGMLLGIFCLSWLNSMKRQKADQFPSACQLSRINNLVACRLPVDAKL